jgi:NAD(P)-dependent dehydrogenase (short-subunit alcohol dehydrogenase family)
VLIMMMMMMMMMMMDDDDNDDDDDVDDDDDDDDDDGNGLSPLTSSPLGLKSMTTLVPELATSKFALEAIADAARMELGAWNISVSMIEPPSIRTKIQEKITGERAAYRHLAKDKVRPVLSLAASDAQRLYVPPSTWCAPIAAIDSTWRCGCGKGRRRRR